MLTIISAVFSLVVFLGYVAILVFGLLALAYYIPVIFRNTIDRF